MKFIFIRSIIWLTLLTLPFATYRILNVEFQNDVLKLAYALAVTGFIIGTATGIPVREKTGTNPELFPIRASSGCWTQVIPVAIFVWLWVMPFVSVITSKLVALGLMALSVVLTVTFISIHKILKQTPRP